MEYHTIENPQLLEGKLLHRDSYKAVMAFEFATCDDEGIACRNASDGREAYFRFYDPKDQKIPDFDAVFTRPTLNPVQFIGITPDKLNRLCKAMHAPTGTVRLQFDGPAGKIRVDVPDIPNQDAIIMPIILNDVLF